MKPHRTLRTRLAALASLMLAAAASVHAQTDVTYIGGNNGSWTTGSNWSGGTAPTTTAFNAIINNGMNVVIPFSPISLNNLTLGSGSLSGSSLVVDGLITLNNGAIVGNNQLHSVVGFNFGSSVTLNNVNPLGNGNGTLAATANWDSGTLTFANSTSVDNRANSTWNANGGLYDSASGSNSFSNNGVFNKNSAAVLTIEPAFNNTGTGTLNVNQGELQLLGGGNHNGAIIVDNGTTLTFGGTHWIGGGSASLSVGSLATLNIASGTTSVDVAYSHTGTATISSGATLNLNGAGVHTGAFNNGGTLNFGGVVARTLASTASLSGAGTINFTNGATTIQAASRSFAGPVNFQGGTASLDAGGSFSGAGSVNFNGATVTTGGAFSIGNPLTLSAGLWNVTDTVEVTNSFAVSGGNLNGAGTLTVNGPLTWSGGTMNGTGIRNANGGATLSGGTKSLGGSQVLNLGGTSTWSAGSFDFQSTGSLVNTAGGVLTTTFDGSMNYNAIVGGNGSFSNAGTFTKSAGAGTTTIGVVFNNTGTVNANSGTLSVNNGGTSTGAWSVSSGSTLNFGGGTQNLNAGTNVNAAGTVGFSGGTTNFNAGTFSVTGTIQINGGTANFNATASTNLLNISSGTVGGSGILSASGLTTWSGGTMNGTGIRNANGGATLSGGTKSLGGSQVLNLGGTSTWSAGSFDFQSTGSLVNTAGGVLTTTFDGSMNYNAIVGGNGSFTNAGTFTKSAGAGTTNMGVSFSNTGTVNVQTGTLALNGTVTQHSGSTLTGGTWNVTNGASISRTAGSNITTIGSAASVTLDGAGSSFAKVTTALATNQGSFTIKNDRDLTTAGAYANSGITRVEDSTTVMTIGTGGASTYTQTGGQTILVNGAMIDATAFNMNGGELHGTGTIDAPLTTTGSTIIGPGLSAGALAITGNATFGSGNLLDMEIGGLIQGIEHDYVSVSGLLTLGGNLRLSFLNSFGSSVTNSDIFTIATAGSPILGSFANVSSGTRLSMADLSGSFIVSYGAGSGFGANNLTLSSFMLVPEPSRALLMMLGLTGVMMRRRRTSAIA